MLLVSVFISCVCLKVHAFCGWTCSWEAFGHGGILRPAILIDRACVCVCGPPLVPDMADQPDDAAVVTRMTTAHDDVSVLAQCCQTLADRLDPWPPFHVTDADHDARQATMVATGAVVAIVTALQRNAQAERLQEQGCRALRLLAYGNEANTTLIGSSGGVEAVLAAMRLHITVAGVQEAGCLALSNLSANHAANQTLIGSSGGVQAIVAAMSTHINVAELQQTGLKALNNLSCDDYANQTLIGSSGGVEAIVAAMRTHADVAAIQEWGCQAIVSPPPPQPPLLALLHCIQRDGRCLFSTL
jgi:hypothetical protein